jgi:hypothetical protein
VGDYPRNAPSGRPCAFTRARQGGHDAAELACGPVAASSGHPRKATARGTRVAAHHRSDSVAKGL